MSASEFLKEVTRIYDAWHEEHQRTGNIPARAVCGRDEQGKKLWCSLPDAGPDLLLRVRLYHLVEYRDGLARCKDGLTPGLSHELAAHLIAADVAATLLKWSLAGVPDDAEEGGTDG
jgi:hypothetical protein